MKKLLLIVLSALSLTAVAQNKKTVAVLDPICRDNSVNAFFQQMVRGAMESAVTASSEYEAYDRSAFDQIQKEQAFQRTGAVSDSQIKKMGEMAGVDYVLVSEVSAFEGYLSAVVKILNITTGKYDKSIDDVTELNPNAVKSKCREMTASMFQSSSEDAFELYKKGVEYNGRQEYTEAFRYFAKAAELGLPEAQYVLGLYYEAGHGVKVNYTEAVKWYRLAAENGNDGAQFFLAQCMEDGKGTPQNTQEAIRWYKMSAEQGNVDAQTILGSKYANGDGVDQDFKLAVHWFRQAAEQDNFEAQRFLGICYDEGLGVNQNYKTAVYWYQKAAEGGDDGAQYNLGTCYYNGKGVSTDLYKAFGLFKEAANQGNINAMYALGVCYENGEGVSSNIYQAKYWYQKAASEGHEQAREALNRL